MNTNTSGKRIQVSNVYIQTNDVTENANTPKGLKGFKRI